MLWLNTAVPPARQPHRFGLLGDDLAGFPNGHRITDDVVSIAIRAIAGATVPPLDEVEIAGGRVTEYEWPVAAAR